MTIIFWNTGHSTGLKVGPGYLLRCPSNLRELFVTKKEARRCRSIVPKGVPSITCHSVPGFIEKNKNVVPGMEVSATYKTLDEESLSRCEAAVHWVLDLHKEGRSLNGSFRHSDLKVTSRGYVKCKIRTLLHLKAADQSECQQDMKAIKKVILQIAGVKKSTDLPTDLKLLMRVLSHYKLGDEVLVKNHPGLKRESKKLSLFMQLFEHFEVLKFTDNNKFQNVVAKVPFKNVWKLLIEANQFLTALFQYRNRMPSYPDDSQGAVLLYRNSIAHLMKGHSLRKKRVLIKGLAKSKKKKSQVQYYCRFKYAEMAHILGGTLPGVISRMMVGLHEVGELSHALA